MRWRWDRVKSQWDCMILLEIAMRCTKNYTVTHFTRIYCTNVLHEYFIHLFYTNYLALKPKQEEIRCSQLLCVICRMSDNMRLQCDCIRCNVIAWDCNEIAWDGNEIASNCNDIAWYCLRLQWDAMWSP